MPGTFSINNLPKIPGAYVDFVAALTTTVPVSVGAVVAVPFTSDWGPLNRAVQVGSLAEWQSIYGSNTQTPGYKAVSQAFRGEAVGGRGGAGAVLAYRMGGSAVAKASRAFTNTTPATALTVTALYEGTKGNTITATVQDYAADSTQTEFIVFVGGSEVERYRFLDADIAGLVTQINASSHWISATLTTTGVALTPVSAVALSGGDDGSTLAAGDWTNLMAALQVFRFGVLAPFDLTDSSILASLVTWQAGLNAAGKRFFTVVGGALDEGYSAAKTRAAAMNDPNMGTIGVGHVVDSNMLDANGAPTVLSTSQLAPRVAGALAYRGESMSMTFARFSGLTLVNGSSVQNISDAIDDGIMLFEQDSNENPVRLNRGRTSFITKTDPARPIAIFSEPKFVKTMQNFEMEITEYAEANVIGVLPVNDRTRQTLVGEMKRRLRLREQANVVQAGWTVVVSQNPPPDDSQNFIKLDYSLGFGRSLEKILNSITVS